MQVIRFALLIAASAIAAAQSSTPAPVQSPPPAERFVSPVWQMQDSGTTAGLRGIDSVDGTVAWASGTGGTVLKTIDGGVHWQKCAVPDAGKDGATLDFRGVQAWDAKNAIVMSSGKGELSRLYKTNDGCLSWKLIFMNPDKDGFWDGFVTSNSHSEGLLIGDQVDGRFAGFAALYTLDRGWYRFDHTVRDPNLHVMVPRSREDILFAASNSILAGSPGGEVAYVTGGNSGSYLHATKWHRMFLIPDSWYTTFEVLPLPLAKGSTAGAFSFATRDGCPANHICSFVVVGGDFLKPNERNGTAAYGAVSNQSEVPSRFVQSDIFPHGYRSSVQWSESLKLWITVGPNGSDLSRDDGKTWQPLDNDNWNALSLPFVVGPNGRIARLNPSALPPEK